jgi:hypothetical protein
MHLHYLRKISEEADVRYYWQCTFFAIYPKQTAVGRVRAVNRIEAPINTLPVADLIGNCTPHRRSFLL